MKLHSIQGNKIVELKYVNPLCCVYTPKAITERSLDQFEIVQGREY